MNFTQEQLNTIVNEAITEARKAAEAAYAQFGARDACGFASTRIYGIKGNTRLGKMLVAAGVRKNSYEKAFELWNPSKMRVQSVGILEAGAEAAANVFRKYGFTAYAWSRLD